MKKYLKIRPNPKTQLTPKKMLRDARRMLKAPSLYREYEFLNDYKRVYHYHIRKTAGASLNFAFWSYSGLSPKKIRKQLSKSGGWYLTEDGKIFVGGKPLLLAQGKYFFGRSHIPSHILVIPEDTFTVSIFRNPIARVLSHYKMMLTAQKNKENHIPPFGLDRLDRPITLNDFMDHVPPEHLKRQLYMYSKKMILQEAFDNIMDLCTYYFFTEEFSEGLATMSTILGLKLEEYHEHKSKTKPEISSSELDRLHEELEDEFRLIKMLKEEKYYIRDRQ
jgi:hypothetical protein